MKVTGPRGLTQSGGASGPARAGGGEGFRIAMPQAATGPAGPSGVSGVAGVMGVEALLALQDVGTPTERRRKSVARAGRLLDALDGIKVSLLSGDLTESQLQQLARALKDERADTEDPKLESLLDDIETRAAVELAKLEVARRAA